MRVTAGYRPLRGPESTFHCPMLRDCESDWSERLGLRYEYIGVVRTKLVAAVSRRFLCANHASPLWCKIFQFWSRPR